MGDDRRIMNTLSPIPMEDVHSLSKNISRVGTAVTRIESTLSVIKEDLFPPVAKEAKAAKEGVIELNGRVSSLEGTPPPTYECVEKDRQSKQDTDIAETRIRVANTGKLLWWLIGLAAIVGSSAIGFAILTRSVAAENTARIQSVDRDLTRHEQSIDNLRRAQEQDRRTYLKEMRALPVEVQKVAEQRDITIEEVIDTTDDMPLTHGERELMKRILKKASRREKQQN